MIWCSVSCRTRLVARKHIQFFIDSDLSDLLNTRSILGFIVIVFNPQNCKYNILEKILLSLRTVFLQIVIITFCQGKINSAFRSA